MDSVVGNRSIEAFEDDPDSALRGDSLLSVETAGNFGPEQTILAYVETNFPAFLGYLSYLRPHHRDMVLEYYLLGKTQNSLGAIHRITQTVASFQLRMCIRAISALMLWKGYPSMDTVQAILTQAGITLEFPIPLCAQLIVEYTQCRSFSELAFTHRIHRPAIRRMMSRCSIMLMEETRLPQEQALGWWLHSLVEKASPRGTGLNRKQLNKMGDLNYYVPDICGQFVVDIGDKDFSSIFSSRANR